MRSVVRQTAMVKAARAPNWAIVAKGETVTNKKPKKSCKTLKRQEILLLQ